MGSPLISWRRGVMLAPLLIAAMYLTTEGSASRLRAGNKLKGGTKEASAYRSAIWNFMEKQGHAASSLSRDAMGTATAMLDVATVVANTTDGERSTTATPNAPMSQEAVRIWLESYNAGPYACLRFKGKVPYRETRNYAPRVMRYYQQDISDSEYDKIIVAAAEKYWLDPQLIRAVVKTESDFRPKLKSHAGARGLMQVMPVVWKDIRARYDLGWNYHDDVWDPEKNVEVACAYLAWLRYDFLPKHFEAFETNPVAPPLMVRHTRLQASVPRLDTTADLAERRVASTEGLGESVTNAIQKVMADSGADRVKLDRRQAKTGQASKSKKSRKRGS